MTRSHGRRNSRRSPLSTANQVVAVGRRVTPLPAVPEPRPMGTRPVSCAPKRQPPLGAAPQYRSPCQEHGNLHLYTDCHSTPVSVSKDSSIRSSVHTRQVRLPKTRLPSDSAVIFYTGPTSAYPAAFPLALASWGIPLSYCLWLATHSCVSKRAIPESGAPWARSVCRFDVTLEGHSYAGFLVE